MTANSNRLGLHTTIAGFVFVLCLICSVSNGQNQQPLSAREIARRTLPSVVLVVMADQTSNSVVYGSGFFVRPDVIATNFHVIENASKGYAKIVGEETKYEIIGAVGIDQSNDLALLKLKAASGKALSLSGTGQVEIGDQVFAVGNPKGLEGTFSQEIVSSIRRDGESRLLQITAPISPGSSGGPVLDASGQVVGVAVGAVEGGQSLNFAIPANYLSALLTKGSNLMPLYIASGSNSGAGSATRRSRPGVVVAPPSPRTIAKPRRSFKKPDLTDDGDLDLKCMGPVIAIEISMHKFTEKFGKREMTPVWTTQKVTFNEFGNVESDELYSYTVNPYDAIVDAAGETPSSGPWGPRRDKWLHRYDYEKQQVTTDWYRAPLTEKILEYRSKEIKQYENGELTESSSYNPDGSLRSKNVTSRRADGSRTIVSFKADGSKSFTEITFTDASGVEVEEGYDENGKLDHVNRKKRTATRDGIIEVLSYPEGPIFKWVTSYDPQTGLEIEATSYVDNQVEEHRKTEYEFDERGNWIRKVRYVEVSKFGKTYFELYRP